MSEQNLPGWWPQARHQGLVQGDAPQQPQEPSILVIGLSLLGAVLCALPLAGLLGLINGFALWFENPVGYALMVGLLVGAAYLLGQPLGVFGHCMALVLWLLGGGLLLVRLSMDMDSVRQHEVAIIAGLSLIAALLQLAAGQISAALWIRRLMGLLCGVATVLCLGYGLALVLGWAALFLAACLLCAAWLGWIWYEPRALQQQPQPAQAMGWAAFVDAAVIGVFCMSLGFGNVSALSELSWSFSEVMDRPGWLIHTVFQLTILLLVPALAAVYLRWKDQASRPVLGLLLWLGLLWAVAAWFLPSLVCVGLVAAGALISGRRRMLILSAVAGLLLLGQYYYALHWPLAAKALSLAVLGALLLAGLLVMQWCAQRKAAPESAVSVTTVSRWSPAQLAWLVAGAVLVFGAVNWDVRGKEQVVAHGQPLLVPLVPVDPRSLMQGDYMALNFDLPSDLRDSLGKVLEPSARVLASVDAQGRAKVLRMAGPKESAGPGQVLLPLKRLKNNWVLVTDAFFFTEGEGEQYEKAKFGEFRALPDGRALLVGLADADGKTIGRSLGGTH